MSRVGRTPITIPQGVNIEVNKDTVRVEGPKGSLEQEYNPVVDIQVEENQCILSRKSESKSAKSYHGLYRQLIQNMVTGVSQGFSRTLVINGVGYRAELNDDRLVLNLGFSTPIEYMVPEGIEITTDGPTKVTVTGMDKQRVGQVASEIRSIRPPEPYKAKGVRYEEERVIQKVGKAGIK